MLWRPVIVEKVVVLVKSSVVYVIHLPNVSCGLYSTRDVCVVN